MKLSMPLLEVMPARLSSGQEGGFSFGQISECPSTADNKGTENEKQDGGSKVDVDDFRKESDREGHLGNSQINCDDAKCKEQSQGSFFDGKAKSREKVFRHEDDEDKGGNRKDKSRYGEKMGGQGIRSEIIKTHGQRNLLGHRFTGFKRHIESHDSETDEREDTEGENDEKNGKTCLNKGKSLFEIALEIPDEIQDDRRSNQNGANNDAGKSHSIDFCREMRASKIAAIGDIEHEERCSLSS